MADAPIKLTLDMPGQVPAMAALSRFAESIDDFTEYWTDYFTPAWYRHMQAQYDTEGGATGDRWAELTAAYAAWKQKHYPGRPIGVLTGATRASLVSPDDPNSIYTVSKDQFEVGTAVNYALFLQLGTGRSGRASGLRKYRDYRYGSGGGMPARPPLRVGEEFLTLATKLLQEFGVKKVREADL